MAHSVGALLLPAPAPDSGEALCDPLLDELTDFFQAVLTKYLGTAWNNVAPGEPIIRHVSKGHDPEEMRFGVSELPTLATWREGDGSPTRLTDGNAESQSTIHVLWVMPPATQEKHAKRFSFFSGFDKVMQLVVAQERDPAYQHPDDLASEEPLVADAAETYGSNVMRRAGIDWWRLLRVTRVPVSIDGAKDSFRGYLATWLVAETTNADPTQFPGIGATAVRFDLTDKPDEIEDPALVRQSAITPPVEP